MKLFTIQALLAASVPLANAFPTALMEKAARDPMLAARALEFSKSLEERQTGADAATKVFERNPQFNSKAQYIDVSPGSGHEFIAPGPTDLRGPCPGLNALANHGFLPRDGYATKAQFIHATETVVGMGQQLANGLAMVGAIFDGDLNAWSIGGKPSLAQGGATGVLANGISGSHNKYETDASPTRPDLYQAGNNWMAEVNQFQDLINYSPGGVVTIDSLVAYRSHRFDQQVASNPHFFFGPFSGVLVNSAAYSFIFRFMANHSAEHPTGELTYSTLASWFGMEGSPGSYKAVQGHERIPDNWYRRSTEHTYELDYFLADVLNAAKLHPKFISVGGNTGKTNTFTGIDLGNLTGGVFNSATLLEGNNLGCFAYQLAAQARADAVLDALHPITDSLASIINFLSCPQLSSSSVDVKQLSAFPGYTSNPVYG